MKLSDIKKKIASLRSVVANILAEATCVAMGIQESENQKPESTLEESMHFVVEKYRPDNKESEAVDAVLTHTLHNQPWPKRLDSVVGLCRDSTQRQITRSDCVMLALSENAGQRNKRQTMYAFGISEDTFKALNTHQSDGLLPISRVGKYVGALMMVDYEACKEAQVAMVRFCETIAEWQALRGKRGLPILQVADMIFDGYAEKPLAMERQAGEIAGMIADFVSAYQYFEVHLPDVMDMVFPAPATYTSEIIQPLSESN